MNSFNRTIYIVLLFLFAFIFFCCDKGKDAVCEVHNANLDREYIASIFDSVIVKGYLKKVDSSYEFRFKSGEDSLLMIYVDFLPCLDADVYLIRDVSMYLVNVLVLYNKKQDVVEFLLDYGGREQYIWIDPITYNIFSFLIEGKFPYDLNGFERYLFRVSPSLAGETCRDDIKKVFDLFRSLYHPPHPLLDELIDDFSMDALLTKDYFINNYSGHVCGDDIKKEMFYSLKSLSEASILTPGVYLYCYPFPNVEVFVVRFSNDSTGFGTCSYRVEGYSF